MFIAHTWGTMRVSSGSLSFSTPPYTKRLISSHQLSPMVKHLHIDPVYTYISLQG